MMDDWHSSPGGIVKRSLAMVALGMARQEKFGHA